MSELREIHTKIDTLLGKCRLESRDFERINTLVNELINIIESYPNIHSYNYIPSKTRAYYNRILDLLDGDEYVVHQKVLLIRLIQKSIKKLDACNFTNYICEGTLRYYKATLDSLINNNFSDNFFNIGDDKFLKVQSICNLSTLPVNPLLLDKDRISIRFLFSQNFKQFIKGAYTIFIKMKGGYPIYKFHNNQVDYHAMKYFNEEGVRKMFLSVAELLKKNKKVKGLSGTSWFFDPKIKSVSPELGYFYDLIIEIGGKVFKHSTGEKTIKNALFLNKRRRTLYEEGKYQPYDYVFVITRKKLMQWSEKINSDNFLVDK